jgi:hypothetical protein
MIFIPSVPKAGMTVMLTSRDPPLSTGDRPRLPRREKFRHACLLFSNGAPGAAKPDDDKMSAFEMAGLVESMA